MGGGGGCRMLDGVSNGNEGAGSGTGCVRLLYLVYCVREVAGARVRGSVSAFSRVCG